MGGETGTQREKNSGDQGKLEIMSASCHKVKRCPGVMETVSLLHSCLTFEPHSPAAGRAERRLSVRSQSQGTRN